MIHILIVWTVVGFAGTQYSTQTRMDWRPLGEFTSEQACNEGARLLALDPKLHRCIPTGRKAP